MSTQSIDRYSSKILFYAAVILLVGAPFHAFISTWLGSNYGHLDAFRLWSEWLLIATVPAVIVNALINKAAWRPVLGSRLFKFSLMFLAVYITTGVIGLINGHINLNATIYSWVTNLRFLYILLLFAVATKANPILSSIWGRLLVLPATAVIIFGLAQKLVLDINFLRHFGYGPNTIPAYSTLDNNLNFTRVQSFLRGANPLGAYLLVIVSFLGLQIKKQKNILLMLLGLLSLSVLFYSYSRSAWIGLLVAGMSIVAIGSSKKQIKYLKISVSIVIVLLSFSVLIARGNTHLQETLFHISDTSSSKQTSNSVRLQAEKDALLDIYHNPGGTGPGSAGPASFRNTGHPPKIAENYFLQIAQEAGLLALIAYSLINFELARILWATRSTELSRLLLATFAGLVIVNLLSHAWVDDSLIYIWWGLAGIALGPVIFNQKKSSK